MTDNIMAPDNNDSQKTKNNLLLPATGFYNSTYHPYKIHHSHCLDVEAEQPAAGAPGAVQLGADPRLPPPLHRHHHQRPARGGAPGAPS